LIEYSEISDRISRQEFVRWASCGAVVLAAHVLFVVAVLARPDMSEEDTGSPIVMVDLAPVASAPSAIPSDQPPAPQVQTESQERVRQDEQRKEKPPEEQVDDTPTRQSEVTLPKREPDPPKETREEKVKQEEQEASHAAAPQSAPVVAALPAAPDPGQVEGPSQAALRRWQTQIQVRLNSEKRYPSSGRGAVGVVEFSFRIDRDGHVLSSEIKRSSGSKALDEEALATITRSDPLPVPPSGMAEKDLVIVTSVRFKSPKEH
jgi:protein TonB